MATTPGDTTYRFAWAHTIVLILIPPATVAAVKFLVCLDLGWAALAMWGYFTVFFVINAAMARASWGEIHGAASMPSTSVAAAAAIVVQLLLLGTVASPA
ncbi:hypothetical protein [Microbacterium sp. Leaf320]|uniref:hypothetical protein n=1 Tax=Microbacterium sp. Leaf320 TaxID=1736334 RepID=UPI0006FD4B81|nr:hypothetical protein [Microbacterium sp. Leaf320]KQQ65412.1 hypothetical protein ASF63_15870 [Microbacterium sp. Leaf320]